jgi:hypothetical protein
MAMSLTFVMSMVAFICGGSCSQGPEDPRSPHQRVLRLSTCTDRGSWRRFSSRSRRPEILRIKPQAPVPVPVFQPLAYSIRPALPC